MGMNVCFVSCFPPSRGRLSEYAYYLLRELACFESIEKIHVFADKIEGGEVSFENGKIVVHRVWRPDSVLSLILLLLRILRVRPHLVHFNVHMAVFGRSRLANFVGLALPFFCRIFGLRTIVTLHNVFDRMDVEKCGFRSSFLNRLGAFLALKLVSFASLVTVTVRSYIRLMRERYGCRAVRWVPHGTWRVNVFKFNGGSFDSSHERNVLFIGHVGPYKNLDLLLRAYKMLDNGLKVRLLIAGGSHPNFPGVLEEYRARCRDPNIRFLGFVPDEELPRVFEMADVVVLPYATCTGTSGVAHLASSFGKPIVATDLPEFRELMGEGCGIILAKHDPKDFAKKIELLLRDRRLAEELKNRSLRFASKRTWNKIAQQFFLCYLEILDMSLLNLSLKNEKSEALVSSNNAANVIMKAR